MSKLTLNLSKSSKLKFENKIIGTDAKPKSFLMIPISEGLNLSIDGVDKTEDGKLITEIEVPPLKDFFKGNKTINEAKLFVQVSKSIFTPWIGEIELVQPVGVETCLKESLINEKDVEISGVNVTLEEIEEDTLEEVCKSNKKKKFTPKKFSTSDYV